MASASPIRDTGWQQEWGDQMSTSIAERIASEPALQALFSAGHKRQVRRQQVVIDEGAHPESLYLIVSGTVAVTTTSPRGELLLAYMYPGDFFGEMGLCADVTERSARICARTDCLLLEIAYARFTELSLQFPQLWPEIASQLAGRLRAVNRRLAEKCRRCSRPIAYGWCCRNSPRGPMGSARRTA